MLWGFFWLWNIESWRERLYTNGNCIFKLWSKVNVHNFNLIQNIFLINILKFQSCLSVMILSMLSVLWRRTLPNKISLEWIECVWLWFFLLQLWLEHFLCLILNFQQGRLSKDDFHLFLIQLFHCMNLQVLLYFHSYRRRFVYCLDVKAKHGKSDNKGAGKRLQLYGQLLFF